MRKLESSAKPIFDSCNVIKQWTIYQNDYFGPLWVADKHRKNGVVTKDFGGLVEQGNLLLTNLPILKTKNVFYYKQYSNYEDTTDFRLYDHPRAFIDVILEVGDKQLQIINVHGCWSVDKMGNDRTKQQTKALLESVRYDIPCIVVGDFNLLPQTNEIRILSNKLNNLIEKYNIKSTRPDFDDGLDKGNMVCDYIFVNDKVQVKDFSVIKTDISDHFPLILDFDI